jgi:hypothetical protein
MPIEDLPRQQLVTPPSAEWEKLVIDETFKDTEVHSVAVEGHNEFDEELFPVASNLFLRTLFLMVQFFYLELQT